jgi:uncharacterized membrane protein YdjX (TVP38/TMEM64 family)
VSDPAEVPEGVSPVDDLAFSGDVTPLLLRKSTIAGLVLGFLALAVGYVVLSEQLGLSYQIDAEPFQEWVDGFGIWGPLVFIVAMAVSVLIAPIPGAPIFVAAGLAWGPVVGTLYSMTGMMLGSSVAFWLSRRFGRKHVPRLVGPRVAARLDHLADSMGGRLVFWARMLPVINFDWISFVAGMTGMRFTTFFIASLAGSLLPTAVGVVAGDSLGKDIRLTLAITGIWVAGLALSAAYFWWRRHHLRVLTSLPPAKVDEPLPSIQEAGTRR